jgi:hypothetical protein
MKTTHSSVRSRSRMFISLAGLALLLPLVTAVAKVTAADLVKAGSRTALEKLIGKPTKSGSDKEQGSDWAVYALPGTLGLKVMYFATGGGLPKTQPDYFTITFDQKRKWSDVANDLGMKPASMTLKKVYEGCFQLINDPIKNWNVYYNVANAKLPGTEELANEGGHPSITIESRSINDDSPD